jgi:hypothetical protein
MTPDVKKWDKKTVEEGWKLVFLGRPVLGCPDF